ncbi:uncharacterized protein A1O9_01342 [Exophiala aquamarina CBS 119918]|uniref:CMP/dCMP-type deaminase domain-containing protein n=1 Tax=Exophiala aquamarina CBS 119918 TaxID=1182545 RepID=A0A072Q626_9EURO|nr:uncharacterized protein A1O9_01342 [Exophiala aquamarina CBS 119918]KEF63365.1 hypothetical protein A1O9_01342 [Exophiala aquamarina CBS 119918]
MKSFTTTIILVLPLLASCSSNDPIPVATREHWMQRAIDALSELTSTPCPFEAFGAAIVNHTDVTNSEHGELICLGVNSIMKLGNPTLHGETAAINNCSGILTSDPYNLSGAEALRAFRDLSIYTTAEACPMCATAIRWAGFKDYTYGTSGKTLKSQGWPQLSLSSSELFEHTSSLPTETRIVPDVLADETDPLFRWQYDSSGKCPAGCRRARVMDTENGEHGRTCIPGDPSEEESLAGEVAEDVAKGTAKGMAGLWSVLFGLFKVAAPVGDEL